MRSEVAGMLSMLGMAPLELGDGPGDDDDDDDEDALLRELVALRHCPNLSRPLAAPLLRRRIDVPWGQK